MIHDLGEGLDGGKLIEWHVNEGDQISNGDIIASIETAKAIVELPSPHSGEVIKQYIKPNTQIQTGNIIADIEIKKDFSYEDEHVDLPLVGKPVHATTMLDEESSMRHHNDHIASPTNMHTNAMIKNMTLSKQVVSATLFDDMIIDDFKEDINITAQIIHKIVSALKKNPSLNAIFNANTHILNISKKIDLGIALNDQDQMLKVPIISSIERYDLHSIEAIIKSIKSEGLKSEYVSSKKKFPTFTLSNIGSIGGKYGTPVLIPPSVAILAIGRIEYKPIVIKDNIIPKRIIPISVTFDHRILTGAQVINFINDLCLN